MKTAFDTCAADYAEARPGYPEAVFDLLAEALRLPGREGRQPPRIVDVGAGTMIFSRMLASYEWSVVALEASHTMLAAGLAAAPHTVDRGLLGAVCGMAERCPLADEITDGVTVAQAFHWFNPPYALSEFARILRPGGVLAMVWNNRDPARHPFVEEYESLIARYNPAYLREYRLQDWSAKIDQCGRFGPVRYHRLEWTWSLPIERFVQFSRTISYIRNVLTTEAMTHFENDLRQLASHHFPDGECQVPMWTDVFLATLPFPE